MRARQALRRLAAVERGVLAGLMAGIALTTFVQVVCRYAFNLPLQWSEEVARFFLVWVTFVGSGTLLRDATGHPKVDTVEQSVSSRARSVLAAVSRVLVLIGCLAMAWGGVRMVALQWAQTSPSIEMSMGIVYLCIPVGALLGVLWALVPPRALPPDDFR